MEHEERTERRMGVGRAWREAAEELVRRADLLSPEDRALIHAIYEDGRSGEEVARLIGVSPRALRRRLARLVERVRSARFLFVGSRLYGWPMTRRRVAAAVVLRGMSVRRAAAELGVSTYAVRVHLQAIDAMLEAALAAATAA